MSACQQELVTFEIILIMSRTSAGLFTMMDCEVYTNQGVTKIVYRAEDMKVYMLFNLLSRIDETRSNAKYMSDAEVSKRGFHEMAIIRPFDATLRALFTTVRTLLKEIRCLKEQVANLQTARDLHLPGLMGGDTVV